MHNDNVKLTINVPVDLHTMIKTHSAVNGVTMKDYILDLVTASMRKTKSKKPNQETIAALMESKKGKTNLYKNINDLFNKLDKMADNSKQKNVKY